MAAQLTTDPVAFVIEAANFERIAGELKAEITRVEQAATGLDEYWQGTAAEAAQSAITRFQQAADAQVRVLNDISTNIHTAAAKYTATDDERAAELASAMGYGMDGDENKQHNGIQLVDWKQGPTPTLSPGHTDQDVRDAIKNLPKGTAPFIAEVRSEQDLRNLWNWASEGGTQRAGSSYPGTERMLPDGTIVGIRESDEHGPTMDIRTPDNTYTKVHINPSRGGVPDIPGRAPGPPEGGSPGARAPEGAAPGPRAPVGAAPVEPPAPRPAPSEPFVPMGPSDPNAFPHPVQPPHSHHGPPVLGRDDMSDLPEYEPE
ncbi:WXG100 family type VII secretion target [Mycobacterium kyorinense]|uniref:WXG100 family type VII secretion target n=1 Tax=Mycobacterium kyorinense TaxID=487514 RepID=UPI00084BDA2D|nr:WXG100 family type VII secretion target [Mycobacterium kyorinense]